MTRLTNDQEAQLLRLADLRQQHRDREHQLRHDAEVKISQALRKDEDLILSVVAALHASGTPTSRIGKALGTKDYRTVTAWIERATQETVAAAYEPAEEPRWTMAPYEGAEGFWLLATNAEELIVQRHENGRFQPGIKHPDYTTQTDPEGTLRELLRDPKAQEMLAGAVGG